MSRYRLPHGFYAGPAALAMMGGDPEDVAARIGISEAKLTAVLSGEAHLTRREFLRLRGIAWRASILVIASPIVDAAISLTALSDLRSLAHIARTSPEFRAGRGYMIFATAWRTWLRATGQGHRISAPAPRTAIAGDEIAPSASTIELHHRHPALAKADAALRRLGIFRSALRDARDRRARRARARPPTRWPTISIDRESP